MKKDSTPIFCACSVTECLQFSSSTFGNGVNARKTATTKRHHLACFISDITQAKKKVYINANIQWTFFLFRNDIVFIEKTMYFLLTPFMKSLGQRFNLNVYKISTFCTQSNVSQAVAFCARKTFPPRCLFIFFDAEACLD